MVSCLLLITRNLTFERLLDQLIQLRIHIINNPIKKICLDNASEFTSHVFNEYCIYIRITIEHLVVYAHAQSGLAKSPIKHLKLIARTFFMIDQNFHCFIGDRQSCIL